MDERVLGAPDGDLSRRGHRAGEGVVQPALGIRRTSISRFTSLNVGVRAGAAAARSSVGMVTGRRAARRETVVTYWGVKTPRRLRTLLELGATPRDDVQDVVMASVETVTILLETPWGLSRIPTSRSLRGGASHGMRLAGRSRSSPGGSGIGQATVELFARKADGGGCRLRRSGGSDNTDRITARRVAMAIRTDVSRADDERALVRATVECYGGGHLVNNAGIGVAATW